MANIAAEAIAALAVAIGGRVSQPGEPGYDEAVNIWNAAAGATRRPALVASCTSSAERRHIARFCAAGGP